MFANNFRMIEGPPLQYHPSYSPPAFLPPQFPFFRRFEPFADMTDEFAVPNSPQSTHSDSDNSLSSTEAPFQPIRPTAIRISEKDSAVRCCWRSCGITFGSLDELASHVTKVHAASGPDGLFYCGWEGCLRNNRGFNARYKMLVHVRTHTNEKPHKCDKCDKSFSRAENLKIHSRSHSGEKPYLCPVPGCNKAYSNSSDRFKHTRTHQVEKPYKCKVPGCPKRYTDPSSLRKHVKTYKHFPNEINEAAKGAASEKMRESCVEERMERERPQEYQPVIMHPYSCIQPCCIPKSAEIFGFGAFIDFKDEVKSVPWNNFADAEPRRLYSPYVLKQDHMDIDVPLDLSINGRHLS